MAKHISSLKVSRFKYFCWLIAGSDIGVLKKCISGNVHNKHAGIGFTILVTSFVACIVGAVAGYRFSDGSLPIAACVGLIWGTIIFSIDRNMVMFLKKDVKQSNRSLWIAFLARAIMAALISFFISIPLEMIFFRQEIAIQMNLEKDGAVKQRKKDLEIGNNTVGNKKRLDSLYQVRKGIEDQLEQLPEGGVYARLIERRNSAEQEKEILQKNYNKTVSERKGFYDQSLVFVDIDGNKIPDKNSKAYRLHLDRRYKSKKQKEELDTKQQAIDELKLEILAYEQKHQSNLAESLQEINQLIDQQKTVVDSTTNAITNNINTLKSVMGESEFSRQWAALNNIENSAIHFLVWLMRAVLWFIEIIPSLLKISGKPDVYDIILAQEEKELIKENKKLIKLERKSSMSNMESTLRHVASAQDELSKKMLEKWKMNMEEKIDEDVEQFVKS